MKRLSWTGILALLALAQGVSPAAAGEDLRNSLQPGNIESARINLAPAGAGLGFEIVIPGDDPRLEALAELIREAGPGGGHKCPNQGAIRFRMKDGSLLGIGLLPGHTAGDYGLRFYEGDHHLGTYLVERADLLEALEALGVPLDDPAFRE